MADRTIKSKLTTYSVDEILVAGGVDKFLKQKHINTSRRRISGTLTVSTEEAQRMLDQLRDQN